MRILPAIDIMNGRVVRLYQGDFDQPTVYSEDPVTIAKELLQQGFKEAHVIDLIGAKQGRPHAYDVIAAIASTGLRIQAGGGIRTIESAQRYLAAGVERVIVGTQCLMNPDFLGTLIATCGADSVVVALDVRNGRVATDGWMKQQTLLIDDILTAFEKQNVHRVIVTDINRDGTLSGSELSLYESIRERYPNLNLYAAGGISTIQTIQDMKRIGLSGAIVGRAFYERPPFREALLTLGREHAK